MQPLQKYPQPDRPQNPSALEMAIYNFELKAKSYFDEKQKENPDEALLKKLTADYTHLQNEKKRIESIVIAQSFLEAYREDCDSSTAENLSKEAHHPTDKISRFLTAIGEPKPTENHEAHHIILGKGRFNPIAIYRARLNLHLLGIGINDPINGTWLINFEKNKKFDWATEKAPAHRKLHRHNYESWIGSTLGYVLGKEMDKDKFINKLRAVKVKIKTGTLPSKIFEPKDELWKGI